MYCRKCGTEQKDGQKYCPKCGEPFLDENGRPYLKGIRKDLQDAKEKLTSKADELTKQGKKLVDEKVQPQLNERLEELKKVNWEEKKNDSVKSMQGFFSNSKKLSTATIWIAIIAVLWFFIINHGFSASWIWWGLAIIVVGAAFYKPKSLNDARKMFAAILFLGLCLVFYSPSSSSSLGNMDDDISVKASNAEEEKILMKMARIYGEIREELPRVEMLYNKHRSFVAQGGNPNFSPAWGKWQDCQDKIMNLWDEYIALARQLDDNEAIIQEARERKRKMNEAFKEMFVPYY